MPELQTSVHKIVIRGPIQDVWREITRTDDVIPCFFNMRMDVDSLAPGSRLRMRSKNGKWTGVVGEITEFDPPKRFAHTFRFTNMDDPECLVIYELREVARGETEFTLRIENLTPGTKSAKQMVSGATMILNTLKATIEKGGPGLGARALFLLFKAMEPMTPKKCLSVNWP